MEPVFLVPEPDYALALSKPGPDSLADIATFNRINALATIHHAQRGWIGASLSCTELLTAIYFDVAETSDDPSEGDIVVLGKGHAAAMQYACLVGLGLIPAEDLLRYKHPDGPQAHTDISTPGIAINTGSLGQALSKCCGLAIAQPERHVYAILGDGELQEGQCFEALQTIRQFGLTNLTVIVDRNGIQSDSNVADIMAIADLPGVLGGFGLEVHEIDGNNIQAVAERLRATRTSSGPVAIIANTRKGAGISFMSASDTERREYCWHGGAPDDAEYITALKELRSQIECPAIGEKLDAYLAEHAPKADQPSAVKADRKPSTASAFAAELLRLASEDDSIRVFDADLEKPCKLTEFASKYPERFYEMGISEQDMVSCAGGFALAGKLPVVNTYGSFFRRAYEQVYVNATEGTKILYAGHYSGLCYGPDGKTHQCTGDVAMMRAIPGMTVLYPATNEEATLMLRWFVEHGNGPAYMRLHRSAPEIEIPAPDATDLLPGHGRQLAANGSKTALLTSGPHMTAYCVAAANELGLDAYSVSWLREVADEFIRHLAESYGSLVVIEELMESGGLLDELSLGFARLSADGSSKRPMIFSKAVSGLTFSTLESCGLYRHFGLDGDSLVEYLKSLPLE